MDKTGKNQLETIIKIVSDLLAKKSPHTGAHCIRVPIIANLIAQAVNKEQSSLNPNDLYLLKAAAFLHDCGKITTPDYLLEKSVKLECPHNRIHEIRTRFEILWRDAEIKYLKNLTRHPEKKKELQAAYQKQKQRLQQDFEFIAQCNNGEKAIKHKEISRLQKLANLRYKRHFNRLSGLSWQEQNALSAHTKQQYETMGWEHLLEDKPEDLYKGINTGELYNLCTEKGTINTEERRQIEKHVTETRNILELLNLTADIKKLVFYASEHHERLNGEGYPLGLTADKLSLPSRILMFADIFEALTSVDRPYKSPKKLSEVLHILKAMKNKQQLDAEIYRIFLTQKVYLKYARKHLQPEQIDNIDINDYL